MKILEFAIKGTEDYAKAQDKEMEDFGKIENLLTDTISNIESGNTPTNPSEPEGPVNNPFTEADIGKYVKYVPVGTDYTAEAKYSGLSTEQVFKQNINLKWKIWKVENDTLYLISENSPSTSGYSNKGELYLKGVQGYNNGVTLLDNICQTNYGISGNSNVKVQNLKIEDVLLVKADGIENSTGSYYESQPYTYSGTFAYPSLWYSKEREGVESAQGNRSIAYPFVEEADATIATSNQQPYHTYWGNDSMNTENAWKNKEYYSMVMHAANTKAYWISSRYIYPYSSSYCYYGLMYIYSGGISDNYVYSYNNSNPNVSERYHGIRPLVSIPLRNCEITENTTTANTFDIVIK